MIRGLVKSFKIFDLKGGNYGFELESNILMSTADLDSSRMCISKLS